MRPGAYLNRKTELGRYHNLTNKKLNMLMKRENSPHGNSSQCSVRPEITGAKITATRGRLFLIRVGTKDQVVKFHFLESESSSVH